MCKVFPNGENIKELEKKQISGLKGETLSFQIAYYWGENRREYGSVSVSSPIKDKIQIRTVKLVPCEYPCHIERDEGYLAITPGLYPDKLSESSDNVVPLISGQWRCLWIDIVLDDKISVGEYPIQLQIKLHDEVLCAPEILCTVIDMPLPKLPIPYTEWFHSDCLAEYYHVEVFSERYWQIVQTYVKMAVKHKCNMLLTPIFTPPLDTAVGEERPTVQLVDVTVSNGNYAFGFEKLRRWIQMALSCGIEYFECSHLFSQWGAKAAPKIMAVKDGLYQQIFGWDTDASGSEYREFLHQFLNAFKRELQVLGITKKVYFHISDEPSMMDLESYQKAWEGVVKDLEGFFIIDALSDYEFYKKGLIQQPICAVDEIKPFLENRPEHLWCYYCTAQSINVPNRFIVLPGYRTRILGTLLYKYQLNGFLHWGYNFYNAQFSRYPINPHQCTDADGAFCSGDPFLVYPKEDGTAQGSIRQMLMDEAMSDYCAFIALEELAGREKVLEYIDEQKITFDEYPQDETYLIQLREKVNQEIVRLLALKKR